MAASSVRLYVGIDSLVQPHPRETTDEPVDVIEDAALLVGGGRVLAVGSRANLMREAGRAEVVDLDGRAVVPGLVDSHTHTVFAGDRADEMARRARGETYEQIARAGGGIRRTVKAVQARSRDELVELAHPRLRAMLARGMTTVEIKSGYGLWPEHELRMLEAVAALRERTPQDLFPTALAHVVPAGEEPDAYVGTFVDAVLVPSAGRRLARFADVFVERGAFSPDHARRIAGVAGRLGLRMKLHVDQLHDGGGARLAAEIGALSADHLDHTSPDGARALAEAGVVATLLPGCPLFLGKGPFPDGRALRKAGCEVAVATDFNPGSSMLLDLGLVGALAATRCGLTLEEALWAITRGGARALGLEDRGCLRPGERADFVVLDTNDWRHLFYAMGHAPIHEVYIEGTPAIEGGRRSSASS